MVLDGENKGFADKFHYYSFDRHLCPGGKLQFSGLWKLGRNGPSSGNLHKALQLHLHSVDTSHGYLYVKLATNPKLLFYGKRDSKPKNQLENHYFGAEFPYDKLVSGYIKCEEDSLDLYFMGEFLFKIPDYKSYHGPVNRIGVGQFNGFFELKSLTMSEGKYGDNFSSFAFSLYEFSSQRNAWWNSK